MTPQQVITELESKGAINVYEGTSFDQKDPEGNVIYKVHRVYYQQTLNDDSDSELKTIQIKENDGNFKFLGSKPSILKDTPEPETPRDFHFSEPEIIQGLENLNDGSEETDHWKIQKVNQSRDGDFDVVRLQVLVNDDGVERGYIERPEFITWWPEPRTDPSTREYRRVQ